MERHLEEILKKYKGQPVEIITESGMKYCGIVIYADECGVDIIDRAGRTVHIEERKIESIIEPRMKLKRLCGKNDCCCNDEDREREEECCESCEE